jgi:hypothetical protein
MNMYIAQANNGSFKIVESLGIIDPREQEIESGSPRPNPVSTA